MPPRPISGGGGVGGKGSPFVNAARVLFDSAQRMGAVRPLDSNNRMYAHQLKKMQNQSRKRGGSLGGVSYKVTEFLATQRTPLSSMGPTPKPNTHSVARKVPLLNIRLANAKPVQPTAPPQPPAAETEQQDASSEKRVPSLDLSFFAPPEAVQQQQQQQEPPPQSVSAATEQKLQEAPPDSQGVAADSLADREAAATVEAAVPDVFITEDRPMFEMRASQVASAPMAAVRSAPAQVMPAVEAPKKAPLSVPSLVAAAGELHEPKAETPPVVAPSFSVESWEQQREKEIARLQQRKQEEESRRLAAILEEEHRVLGEKWVETRTIRTVTTTPPSTEEAKLGYFIATTSSLEDALSQLEKLVNLGTRASNVVPTAAWAVAQKITKAPPIQRFACLDRFLPLVEKASLPADVKSKIKLRFAAGADLITQYHAMDEHARRNLGRPQVKKLVGALTSAGFWEEAVQLVETSRTYLGDRDGSVELCLASTARWMDADTMAAVAAYVTKTLTASGRLGADARLELALLSPTRRSSLAQLAASPEADERVYGELLKRTASDKVDAVLAEVEKRGLNKDDPHILAALVGVKVRSEDPLEVFMEIERQAVKVDYCAFHLSAALAAVRWTPSKEVLTSAMKIALKLPGSQPRRTLRTLLPFLYANEMFDEIVELVDRYSEYVPIARTLPAHTAFANEALIKAGREPLSAMTVKECGVTVPEAGEAGGGSFAKSRADAEDHLSHEKASATLATTTATAATRHGATAPSSVAGTGDLTTVTEKMLSFAKDKQWASALGVLDTLIGVPARDSSGNSTAAALTLVYNCALSAAVENPEVVLSVVELMKERHVSVNPTTVNTVLSSLSKSARWQESLAFFEKTTARQRDMNTYLVMVSLLGKHNKWEEAVKVFDEMKKVTPKPPATIFTIAVGATANHSWSDTLRIFQEMLKLHGATVKDSVINQVVRCLEQNGKTAELARLEKEIQKRRKKKK